MNILKILTKNKTARNGGMFSIFSFVNKGISLLIMMILARYIGTEEYGELSIFNTFVMFLGYFVGLSTAGYCSVSYFKKSDNEFKKDFTAISLITICVSLIILILLTVSSQWISGLVKVSVRFLFVGLLISFANVFVGLNLDYLRIQEKVSLYGILSCGFALLNLGLTLCFVIQRESGWEGRVYAQLICDILFGVIAFVWFTKDHLFSLSLRWNCYKTIIYWGVPIIPHLATQWMKQGLDRYIINAFYTMSEVGIFSFALNLMSMVTMIGIAFNQTNSVNIYKTLSLGSLTNAQKMTMVYRKERMFNLMYLVSTVVMLVVGCILVPFIMPNYTMSLPFFFILSISGFLQCVYLVYCNYLFYYNNTKQLMYITFGTSVFHVILSLFFTRYSLYLTAIIYVLTQLIVTFLVYRQSRKLIKKKIYEKN